MSPLEKLKSEAAALEAKARDLGHAIKHSAALEQVARNHGFRGWRACLATLSDATSSERPVSPVEMNRYESPEWQFSINIPKRWNVFPAVPSNSPYEVVRFASHENGKHLLIVFREPYDPEESPAAYSKTIQDILEKEGFSNFLDGQATIGSNTVTTLDFDKALAGTTWSCRHYFIIDGSTLAYTLGFGTTKWDTMIKLYDRIAKSFCKEKALSSPPS